MRVDHASRVLHPLNLEEFLYSLDFFEDQSIVSVTIEPYIRKVEQSQMGLLHAYLKMIHEETGDDLKDLKVEMKERYGARNEDGTLKSTAAYTTTEMNKLIEGVVIFMTQFLGINTPSPEEWKKKKLQ